MKVKELDKNKDAVSLTWPWDRQSWVRKRNEEAPPTAHGADSRLQGGRQVRVRGQVHLSWWGPLRSSVQHESWLAFWGRGWRSPLVSRSSWDQDSKISNCTLLRSIQIKILRKRPQWLGGKESARNAGETCSIPGSGRSPRGGNGRLLQHPCLENAMDRGAWWATVHGAVRGRHDWAQANTKGS